MNQNNQSHDTVILKKQDNDIEKVSFFRDQSEHSYKVSFIPQGIIESTKPVASSVIEKIIYNQWYNNNYLNEYISFLLGACTDEEFNEISAKFVRDFEDLSMEEIQYAIIKIKNIFKKNLDIDEFSTMLNVTHNSIIQALKKMGNK